jgi:hypothetical protein
MPKKTTKVTNTHIAAAAGFALAAAAAGAYFLYGKDAPKRRAKVRGWMLKAKGEILEQIEKLSELDQETYYALVDAVSSKYSALKSVEAAEVAALVRELRSGWSSIKRQVASPKKAAKKAVKKVAKKAAKKAATKSR